MKNKLLLILPLLFILVLSNCSKEKKNNTTPGTPAEYFLPMKTGNFWVYRTQIENGTYPNYTVNTVYDTVKVRRDTVIGGRTYYEIIQGGLIGLGSGLYADSAGWIIHYTDGLFPLSTAANDTITQDTIGGILYLVYKTGAADTSVMVPSGNYNCTEMIGDAYYLNGPPPAPHTNPRQLFSYYSRGIGVVKSLTWYASASGNITSELHTYYIQP